MVHRPILVEQPTQVDGNVPEDRPRLHAARFHPRGDAAREVGGSPMRARRPERVGGEEERLLRQPFGDEVELLQTLPDLLRADASGKLEPGQVSFVARHELVGGDRRGRRPNLELGEELAKLRHRLGGGIQQRVEGPLGELYPLLVRRILEHLPAVGERADQAEKDRVTGQSDGDVGSRPADPRPGGSTNRVHARLPDRVPGASLGVHPEDLHRPFVDAEQALRVDRDRDDRGLELARTLDHYGLRQRAQRGSGQWVGGSPRLEDASLESCRGTSRHYGRCAVDPGSDRCHARHPLCKPGRPSA